MAIGFQKGNKVGPLPKQPCPFGCKPGHGVTNTNGWCQHLIGWTDDGLILALREKDPDPTNASAERELCRNLVPVEEGDAVFAGPSPSKRVFRATGNAPYATGTYTSHGKPVKPQRKPEDVLKDQLKQRDEELDKLRAEVEEMRRLRAEKAELEAELEADPPPRGKGGKFTKKPELQEQGV